VKDFDENYWNVYSKFFDYLYDMSITNLSTKESIYQLQLYLFDLYKWNGFVKGTWDKLLRDHVADYQSKNNIYGFGYCDVETESNMRQDISKGKRYQLGGV
jgi:hypothetical protein